MRKALCSMFGQMLLLAGCAVGAQESAALPELRSLGLDNMSPGIREQIQEAYREARAHLGDDAVCGRLGMVLETYGLLKDAARCYRRAAQLAPSTFRWAYYLGVVEAGEGQCDAAASTLRLSLRLDPNYVPAQLRLASCLLASADWIRSGELYAAITKHHPDNADAYYGLGRVRAAGHDLAGAAEAYRQACALYPNFGAAHYALALVYRALGQVGQAEEQLHLYERDKDRAPPSGDPLFDEVRALNRSATQQIQIGIELERQGRLEESVAAHEKAVEIDSQLVQAHVNLVELYGRLGQFEKAEEHFRTASHLDPGSSEGYYNYGVLLLSAEKYQQAENAFQKTIEIDPFHAGAHNNLGFLLERQGRLLEAEAEYQTAVENKPNNRQAHFNLGRVLVNLGKYEQGIQELEKTIEPEDEDTPRYKYALGAAFARSGDRQNALRYIRQARDGAVALGQSGLVASMERDLHTLEAPRTPQ